MLPNYARFVADEKWGDLGSLRTALDVIWDACLIGRASGMDIDVDRCEAAAPNGEHFSSLYVTSAQEAAFAVCALGDFLRDPDPQHIVSALQFSTDSVDLLVQEQEALNSRDPLLEQKILRHPLMQQELIRQRRDISDALRLDVGQAGDLLAFRQRAASECNLILA